MSTDKSYMTDEFRNDLPEECPFEGSLDPNGLKVYRITKNETPEEKDFMSHWEKNEEKRASYIRDSRTHCRSMGISLHASLADSQNALKLPQLRKNKGIVALGLFSSSGIITPADEKGHLTCWFYSQVDPIELIMEENESKL